MTSRLWYRAAVGDDAIAANQISTIREQFEEALRAAGWPAGACLFLVTRPARRGTAKDEDAEALFFSPAAIAAVPHLIALCRAEPAPPPDRACATLLVGNESDWGLLPRPTH